MTFDSDPVRGGCPQDSTLAAFDAEALEPTVRESVERHARDCVACRLVLGALRSRTGSLEAKASGDETVDAFVARVASQARHAAQPGDHVGRYVIERAVGAGAMGIVYAAHDPELDRRVALKLMRPTKGQEQGEVRSRMQQEARAMARLAHPNVVAVHDVGASGDQVFVAMELVEGETLGEWMRTGSHDVDTTISLFLSVARGLAAAHAVGLVHRDLKPQNILVGHDGRARITDFGLARISAKTPSGTESTSEEAIRELVGTPAYMAPEQLRGEPADARSDQYAFSLCLYEALLGSLPARERPADPKGLPPHVEKALLRGLSADPRDRFASMDEYTEALSTEARPRAQERRGIVGRAGAAALVVAIGALLFIVGRSVDASRSRRSAETRAVPHEESEPKREGERPVPPLPPSSPPSTASGSPPFERSSSAASSNARSSSSAARAPSRASSAASAESIGSSTKLGPNGTPLIQ